MYIITRMSTSMREYKPRDVTLSSWHFRYNFKPVRVFFFYKEGKKTRTVKIFGVYC